MLTRSAWQEVLVQAGFANELAWPAQESPSLRQHLLVARSPSVNRPDKKAVSRHLQQRFGTGLPICCRSGKEKRYLHRRMPRLIRRLSQPNPRQLPGGIRRWKNRWLNSGNRCCLAPWQGITTFSNWAATA
ncbi:hypothetical protein MJK72_18905 [Klebsiella pneumoniae]|nr:hypothetical protein MJK72_18905 [Klebsiella pneumoniae]